eukprot:scaffold78034_cov23-Tisochrysis_lutea.AAC.2
MKQLQVRAARPGGPSERIACSPTQMCPASDRLGPHPRRQGSHKCKAPASRRSSCLKAVACGATPWRRLFRLQWCAASSPACRRWPVALACAAAASIHVRPLIQQGMVRIPHDSMANRFEASSVIASAADWMDQGARPSTAGTAPVLP